MFGLWIHVTTLHKVCKILPPTLSGPVSITSQGIGEKMVPSVFPGTPILQLYKNIFRSNMGTKKKMCMANYGKSDQTSQTSDHTVLCWPKSIIFVMLSSLSSLWLKHTYGKLHKCKCFSWFRLYFESFK